MLAQAMALDIVYLQATRAMSCAAREDWSASAPVCSQHLATLAISDMPTNHTNQLDVIFSFSISLIDGE